jgi:hypothetical protein
MLDASQPSIATITLAVDILTEFEEKGGNVRASGDILSKGFEIQIDNAYARDHREGSDDKSIRIEPLK